MPATLPQAERLSLLNSVETPSPLKVSVLTTREKREEAAGILRVAIARSDLKLNAVSDKDHGQLSREIDDKEKLSFHEMYATWPKAVWRELIPELAAKFGFSVKTTIELEKSA